MIDKYFSTCRRAISFVICDQLKSLKPICVLNSKNNRICVNYIQDKMW